MRLTPRAIDLIRGSRKTILLLAIENDVNEDTMRRWLSSNAENSGLTNIASVRVIKEQTGLQEDKILK